VRANGSNYRLSTVVGHAIAQHGVYRGSTGKPIYPDKVSRVSVPAAGQTVDNLQCSKMATKIFHGYILQRLKDDMKTQNRATAMATAAA
jgi:hypothetical protein